MTDQQLYISRASLDRRQREGARAGVDRLDFATCSSPAAQPAHDRLSLMETAARAGVSTTARSSRASFPQDVEARWLFPNRPGFFQTQWAVLAQNFER